MKHYPIFLDISGKKCVVVGGGKVAERKVKSLLACSANVHVISPELNAELMEIARQKQIFHSRNYYHPQDLNGACLVICATNDNKVNAAIAKECAKLNIPVNVVDEPSLCTFIVPSTVNRGALQLAISTGGKSPGMARTLREILEKEFGPQFADFIDFVGEIRNHVLINIEDPERRKEILANLVDTVTIDLVQQGDLELAKERVRIVYNCSGLKP